VEEGPQQLIFCWAFREKAQESSSRKMTTFFMFVFLNGNEEQRTSSYVRSLQNNFPSPRTGYPPGWGKMNGSGLNFPPGGSGVFLDIQSLVHFIHIAEGHLSWFEKIAVVLHDLLEFIFPFYHFPRVN
jgi:hypothetical protein